MIHEEKTLRLTIRFICHNDDKSHSTGLLLVTVQGEADSEFASTAVVWQSRQREMYVLACDK